jgi:hypothetical protein
VNEIGGNKILLRDKGTRIFFDFGQSFKLGADYFTSWLAPRAVNGFGDYFAFDLLPKIKGLYSEGMLASTDLPYTEPQVEYIHSTNSMVRTSQKWL